MNAAKSSYFVAFFLHKRSVYEMGCGEHAANVYTFIRMRCEEPHKILHKNIVENAK